MKNKKTKRFLVAMCLLLVSATMLGTASYAWFSMNTQVEVDGIQIEAYSDSLFLEISDDEDGTYATSLSLASNGEKVLRLAKHGFVGAAYNLTITPASGEYNGTGTYYKMIAETGDSYAKYVKVTPARGSDLAGYYKNLAFTLAANDAVVGEDDDTVYYELVAAKYVPVAKAEGESVKGLYTLAAATAETAGYFEGQDASARYFLKGADDSYTDITTTLKRGEDLSAYVTITNPVAVTLTAATGDVYLANTITEGSTSYTEYAFYGSYASATNLTNELYFGRAYSDTIADGDLDDTLSIIKTGSLESYRYYDTVYLRNAENTNNSKNLQAHVTFGGATNNLAPALRVLLVASIDDQVVNTATCAFGGTIQYANGTNLVDVLLGNQAETLKVDIYVYFDGTDTVATNASIATGALDGQTVNLKFTIDAPAYNQTPVNP